MDARRSQRITEALREELGEMIDYELNDPRIGAVTVTEVHVSPDGKKAQISVLLEGDKQRQQAALDALNKAKGFLRHELGERLTLFRVPDLHFESALSPGMNPEKIDFLLRRIRRGRPRDEHEKKNPL